MKIKNNLLLEKALAPFANLGGMWNMPAYHDLEDDIVIYENSGACITAGDVRAARKAIELSRKDRIFS